jgi:hypothetical protein
LSALVPFDRTVRFMMHGAVKRSKFTSLHLTAFHFLSS